MLRSKIVLASLTLSVTLTNAGNCFETNYEARYGHAIEFSPAPVKSQKKGDGRSEPGRGATAKSEDGKSLNDAAFAGDVEAVGKLLARGVDVNARSSDGKTPLISALILGSKRTTEIVPMLLAKGADVNARDNAGSTALMGAARNYPAFFGLLLAKGADVNLRDRDGATAVMFASSQGFIEAVEALLAKGADVNARDKNGYTALMLAAYGGHIKIVQALLSKGADANARANDGKTALTLAVEKGHAQLIELLKKAATSKS
jgi:ankyrin repeat protein